ncbi:hypothetical protein DYL59_20505 [Pseudomonas kairouanensis]|uniref:Uncharacterized protein n=1 Tax=Pseudomonas kairouanensis TaxID=2293832 RepID=A0A4Z0AJI5_9PSED|nr:hypothetical protein [Pseudomonas kairouanensis]TFY86942.1 hypothetical protein DYL59_20505 [Pseudomonas kairouanensis]
MYINSTELSENDTSTTQSHTPAALDETSDISFFNAQLSTTGQTGNGVASGLFAAHAPESTAASKRIKRGTRDTMLNKKTKEAHALPELMATANLDVVARVKMLGLLVKSVDKVATMG